MKPIVAYPDFEKLDIRIGQVVEATAPEWSRKLLQLTVDFGAEIGVRTILSGVAKWYQPNEFLGKKFAFIVNLAERPMGPSISQGMMLMADTADQPVFIEITQSVPVGSVVR